MMIQKREEDEEMEVRAAAISSFTGGIFNLPADYGNSGSLGFMELFGFHDLPQSVFDTVPPHPPFTSASAPPESSETVNFPATPNSSSISSSSAEATTDAALAIPFSAPPVAEGDGNEEPQKMESNSNRGKKKSEGQKHHREARFAFLTKSEVDNLEDGFRWRKYGQKAVKNSPFPRSYYRCSNAMCGVKKRVERSSSDSSVVVTTYEGQHTHACPSPPRGKTLFSPPPAAQKQLFDHHRVQLQSRQPHFGHFPAVSSHLLSDLRSASDATSSCQLQRPQKLRGGRRTPLGITVSYVIRSPP